MPSTGKSTTARQALTTHMRGGSRQIQEHLITTGQSPSHRPNPLLGRGEATASCQANSGSPVGRHRPVITGAPSTCHRGRPPHTQTPAARGHTNEQFSNCISQSWQSQQPCCPTGSAWRHKAAPKGTGPGSLITTGLGGRHHGHEPEGVWPCSWSKHSPRRTPTLMVPIPPADQHTSHSPQHGARATHQVPSLSLALFDTAERPHQDHSHQQLQGACSISSTRMWAVTAITNKP